MNNIRDIVINNGDICPVGNGDLLSVCGVDVMFNRAIILMSIRKGEFYLSPNMGVNITANQSYTLAELEMIFNEAIASIGGVSVKVVSINDRVANVRLKYNNFSKDCVVRF